MSPEPSAEDAPGERPVFRWDDFRADLADYLADLARYRMPFGRFQGAALHELPIEYLRWFLDQGGGFPAGRLGELMAFVYHTKADGAEIIFAPLRRRPREPEPPGEPF